MNPELWGNLPPDLIERIAHFADIDSRRALGFGPRKLPPCHFDFPGREDLAGYVTVRFSSDNLLIRHSYEGQLDSYLWIFAYSMHPLDHRVYGMDCMGSISIYNDRESKKSHHPDFNEDGSFKRSRRL